MDSQACSACYFILNYKPPLRGTTSLVCEDWPLRAWAQLENPQSEANVPNDPHSSFCSEAVHGDEEGGVKHQTVGEFRVWVCGRKLNEVSHDITDLTLPSIVEYQYPNLLFQKTMT